MMCYHKITKHSFMLESFDLGTKMLNVGSIDNSTKLHCQSNVVNRNVECVHRCCQNVPDSVF